MARATPCPPAPVVSRVLSAVTAAGLVLAALAGTARPAQAQAGRGCSVFNQCPSGYSCHPFIQRCYNVPRREGQPCMAGHACGAGLRCAAGSQRCERVSSGGGGGGGGGGNPLGRGCSVFNQCPSGYSCHPVVQRCYNVPRREGQPCMAGHECGAGLTCEAGTHVCRAPGREGDPCHATRPCGSGLTCDPAQGMRCSARTVTSCPDLAMWCPTGERFRRGTSWDAGTLRCRPARPIETTLRAQCGSPAGVPRNDLDWWYRQARQDNACSGPVGPAMSNWGANYPFLHEACVVHDMCYRTPRPKAQCDQEFFQNMDAVCRNAGASDAALSQACQAVRGVAYAAMQHPQAQDAYDGDQRELNRHVVAGTSSRAVALLSQGRPAAQSSTDFGGQASRAVDGNTNGNWSGGSVSHTGNGPREWWMVDLGADYAIQSIAVYNRTDCCAERLDATLFVTRQPGVSAPRVFQWAVRGPQARIDVPVASSGTVIGRYVYVQQNGTNYLQLAEVQVVGARP